jgi:hypothetical protein
MIVEQIWTGNEYRNFNVSAQSDRQVRHVVAAPAWG